MHYKLLAKNLANEGHRLQKNNPDTGAPEGELEMDEEDWLRVLQILIKSDERIASILDG